MRTGRSILKAHFTSCLLANEKAVKVMKKKSSEIAVLYIIYYSEWGKRKHHNRVKARSTFRTLFQMIASCEWVMDLAQNRSSASYLEMLRRRFEKFLIKFVNEE
ncbi:hypothetical protein NPIL_225111 [Nephila pilipes]|uniref:Uncharacterized protein n=1 Tax=Nephila pilipes TaxID=299642 RepID=A0A8X6TNG6_NEPPI|nr:hypothetical protein NPIL_225111 [Nephila pilipes]